MAAVSQERVQTPARLGGRPRCPVGFSRLAYNDVDHRGVLQRVALSHSSLVQLGFRHADALLPQASTDEQNASRARNQVEAFAAERGLVIASTYVENESGAKLARPELFRLIADSRPGDVLLIEQVDRLSRLTATARSFCQSQPRPRSKFGLSRWTCRPHGCWRRRRTNFRPACSRLSTA
jgi:hypothetical protein